MIGFIEQGRMSLVMPAVKESAVPIVAESSKSGQNSLDNRPVCLALPLGNCVSLEKLINLKTYSLGVLVYKSMTI